MLRKIKRIIALFVIAILLCACGREPKPHSKEEVKEYAREIIEHDDFTIKVLSKGIGIIVYEVKDNKENFTFNIMDEIYRTYIFGGSWYEEDYDLRNDIRDRLAKEIYNNSTVKDVIQLENKYDFRCRFADVNGIKKCADAYSSFQDQINYYNSNSKYKFDISPLDCGYVRGKYSIYYPKEDIADYEFIRNEYFEDGIIARSESILNEIPADEYDLRVNHIIEKYGFCKLYKEENNEIKYYDYSNGKLARHCNLIHLDFLLDVLKQEGFQVIKEEDEKYKVSRIEDGFNKIYTIEKDGDKYRVNNVCDNDHKEDLCYNKGSCPFKKVNTIFGLKINEKHDYEKIIDYNDGINTIKFDDMVITFDKFYSLEKSKSKDETAVKIPLKIKNISNEEIGSEIIIDITGPQNNRLMKASDQFFTNELSYIDKFQPNITCNRNFYFNYDGEGKYKFEILHGGVWKSLEFTIK